MSTSMDVRDMSSEISAKIASQAISWSTMSAVTSIV